jgi:hypothetical protein
MQFYAKLFGQPQSLFITLKSRGALIRAVGQDHRLPNTKYFDRRLGSEEKPLVGTRTFEFPLPLAPQALKVELINEFTGDSSDFRITNLQMHPLRRYNLWMRPVTKAFMDFAMDFAQKAGYVRAGLYVSKCGRFHIQLSEQIHDRDTGKLLFTPARVSKRTGFMEVSRAQFKGYTLAMRMMILLHEWMHYEMQTREESEADLNALRIYLAHGFSQVEANYAVTKIFRTDRPDWLDRANEINLFIKDFIRTNTLQRR